MHLCTRHFQEDFERKAKRAIRIHSWVRPGDHIGIVLDSGTGGRALAYFLSGLLLKRRDISLSAITPNRELPPCRDPADDITIVRSLEIPWCLASVQDEPGRAPGPIPYQATHRAACARCSVDRVRCITLTARKQGITRIALGLDLDDLSGAVLTGILQGEPDRYTRRLSRESSIQLMTPFMDIPCREVSLYAYLAGITGPMHAPARCPYCDEIFRLQVQAHVDTYTYRHPATRYALVHLRKALGGVETGSGPAGSGRGHPGYCEGTEEGNRSKGRTHHGN